MLLCFAFMAGVRSRAKSLWRRARKSRFFGLEWSLLPIVPAAMDMAKTPFANPLKKTTHEKRSMSQLIVRAGDFTFQARFEEDLAPKTVAAFRKAMPFE